MQTTPNKTVDNSLYKKIINCGFEGLANDYLKKSCANYEIEFMCLELFQIISKYTQLINTPVKVDFITRKKANPVSKEIEELEHAFWLKSVNYHAHKEKCSNCETYLKSGIKTCPACFTDNVGFTMSYSDMTRTNVNVKYSYFRKSHFYECLIQFQGKQSVNVNPDIISKLKRTYQQNKNMQITKLNIMKWLKDINASHHYEDIHLIYSIITDIPCPNLDEYESRLMKDFDIFLTEYNNFFSKGNFKTRKNFINIQYVLYQLLMRHNFPCKQDDFILPRTAEIKKYYDSLCKEIFNELKWNHTSLS